VLASCLFSSDTVVNRNRGVERPTSAGGRDLIARPTIRWVVDATSTYVYLLTLDMIRYSSDQAECLGAGEGAG
jgi:hypothetical protein